MIGVLSAIAVAGGALLGRWAASRHREPRSDLGRDDKSEAPDPPRDRASSVPDATSASENRVEAAPSAIEADWRIFPCALGDVVLRGYDQAEAWLAGGILLWEDAPCAVLFIAPDAAGERAIYARPRPNETLGWLAPVRSDAFLSGAEPPSVVEIEGQRFDRRRRLPLRAQRVGTGTPEVTGTAILGEYAGSAGAVLVVLIADGVARAWRGVELREGDYEVWSGEKAGG